MSSWKPYSTPGRMYDPVLDRTVSSNTNGISGTASRNIGHQTVPDSLSTLGAALHHHHHRQQQQRQQRQQPDPDQDDQEEDEVDYQESNDQDDQEDDSRRYYSNNAGGRDGSQDSPQQRRANTGTSVNSTGGSTSQGKRKRLQPSCTNCYSRKIKCNKEQPICSSCVKRELTSTCKYIDRRDADPSQLPPPRKASSHGHNHPSSTNRITAPSASVPQPDFRSTCGSMLLRDPYLVQSQRAQVLGSSNASAAIDHPYSSRAVQSLPTSATHGGSAPSSTLNDALREMPADALEAFVDRIASVVVAKLDKQGRQQAVSESRRGVEYGVGDALSTETIIEPIARSNSRTREKLNDRQNANTPDTLVNTPSNETAILTASQNWVGEALAILPNDAVIDFCIDFYLTELEPFYNCANGPILRKDVEQFKRDRARIEETAREKGVGGSDGWSNPKGTPAGASKQSRAGMTGVNGARAGSHQESARPAWSAYGTPPANAAQRHSAAWTSISGSVQGERTDENLQTLQQKPTPPVDSTLSARSTERVTDSETSPATQIGGTSTLKPWVPDPNIDPARHFVTGAPPNVYNELDLPMLALIFTILGMTIGALDDDEAVAHGLTLPGMDKEESLGTYRAFGEQGLTLSKWVDRPTIVSLQTIALLRILMARVFRLTAVLTISAAAIRSAATMGLHRLGSAVEDSVRWTTSIVEEHPHVRELQMSAEVEQTKELPAWSKPDWHHCKTSEFAPGDHKMRELGRKIWFAFVSQDWAFAPRFDRFYTSQPMLFTTKLPANLNDEQLADLPLHSALPPIDPDQPTDRAFIETTLLLSEISRKHVDRVIEYGVTYEITMQCDAEIRSVLDTLPWYYSFDLPGEGAKKLHQVIRDRPITSVQRVLVHEAIWHALLRTHRCYLGLGMRDQRYAQSTQTCIEAAQFIIAVSHELDRAKSRARKLWYWPIHIFHASIILIIDLIHSAAGPVTPEIAQKQQASASAIKMLQNSTMTKPKPGFATSPLTDLIEFSKKEAQHRQLWEERQQKQTNPTAATQVNTNGPSHPWMGQKTSDVAAGNESMASVPSSGLMDASVPKNTSLLPTEDWEEVLRSFLPGPVYPDGATDTDPNATSSDLQLFLQDLLTPGMHTL